MTTPKGSPSPYPWSWGWYDDTDLIKPDALCQVNGSEIGIYAEGPHMNPVDLALIAAAPRMAEMLRELEWKARDASILGQHYCVECGQLKKYGHKKPDQTINNQGCRLAALLADLGHPAKEET